MPFASTKTCPIIFADDTNLFISDKSVENAIKSMNTELKNVTAWFRANKLSLNVDKTKFSIFHSKMRKLPPNISKLFVDGTEIKRETVTKFLGVYIDERLTWKSHINNITKIISKNIGILYSARNNLFKQHLKQLYFSFIHSYLNYCNIAWASTYKSSLTSIFRRQKHAIRVINNKDRFTSSQPLFIEDRVLDVYSLNIFQVLCMVYKCKEKSSPRIFHHIYAKKTPNKYSSRQMDELYVPFSATRSSDFCLSNRGPCMWNAIVVRNQDLLQAPNLSIFKRKLKKVLLESKGIVDTYF